MKRRSVLKTLGLLLVKPKVGVDLLRRTNLPTKLIQPKIISGTVKITGPSEMPALALQRAYAQTFLNMIEDQHDLWRNYSNDAS